MNLNFNEIPAVTAANDNNRNWIEDLELNHNANDLSEYVMRLTPETASYLGLQTNGITIGYFEYLLDGYVADEDEEASRRLIELMDVWAGPDWR